MLHLIAIAAHIEPPHADCAAQIRPPGRPSLADHGVGDLVLELVDPRSEPLMVLACRIERRAFADAPILAGLRHRLDGGGQLLFVAFEIFLELIQAFRCHLEALSLLIFDMCGSRGGCGSLDAQMAAEVDLGVAPRLPAEAQELLDRNQPRRDLLRIRSNRLLKRRHLMRR